MTWIVTANSNQCRIYHYDGKVEMMSPRKNGHSTKQLFALQNIPGLSSQV